MFLASHKGGQRAFELCDFNSLANGSLGRTSSLPSAQSLRSAPQSSQGMLFPVPFLRRIPNNPHPDPNCLLALLSRPTVFFFVVSIIVAITIIPAHNTFFALRSCFLSQTLSSSHPSYVEMPYNTRRKSICLPALGIQLPNSQSSRAHRPSLSKSSIDQEPQNAHPPKRLKRSHASASPSPETPAQSPSTTLVAPKTVTFADRPKNNGRHAYEHTPPPSPGASNGGKIDMDNIHDDIVAGVIEQLESTGNRPHLIKELASVLANRNASVNRCVYRPISNPMVSKSDI